MTTLNFFKPNIIKLLTNFGNKLGCKLILQLHSIFFFLLDVNFDKFIIELHVLLTSSILAKFQEDQKSIVYVINQMFKF